MFLMIFQSPMGLGKSRCDIPSGLTQGWVCLKVQYIYFWVQILVLGSTIIIFTNLMLCNIIFKIIINFIIEGSMSIFIVHIGIIRPLFHFDYTNFKVSSVITIINFNEIKKMAYLAKLVIFHMNVITCENFNLPLIYCIFVENHFLK